MKKRVFILYFILLIGTNCIAQFSKTHYIPPLSSSVITSGEQYLYISTPSNTPVNVRIIEIGGGITVQTASKTNPLIYFIGNGNDTQLHVDASIANSVLDNKGYIIEAEDQVYVSARVIDQSGNQAGELVSKGLASLGNRFRVGAFLNTNVTNYTDIHYTFFSVLATENDTTVNFSDIPTNAVIVNGGTFPATINLNSGESYVIAVQGPNSQNRDALIGALITSDKPIAVNCGSFGGSNATGNLDLGFDQIVPANRINSNDYVFIKSTGIDTVERVILVADEDGTQISLSGNPPSFTLNAGEYVALTGADFTPNGNLYVSTTKRVFAYQCIGDNSNPDQRNQEMFFVPPLSCQTPRVIDNIPQIESIGSRIFTGRVTIVTKTGSTLDFTIDGVNYTLASLAGFTSITGPTAVVGNANYVTYTIIGLTGNVSVFSSSELYLAAYGSSAAATFGGFYSGFTFKPEIKISPINVNDIACLPNAVNLSVNSLSPFDTFQWYFNTSLIPGATNSAYTPTQPGNYYVSATIAACGSDFDSFEIPVSNCAADTDTDGVNNNIDLDNDDDGIANCTESLGNKEFGFLITGIESIVVGSNYTNSYASVISFGGFNAPLPNAFTPLGNGNFVTEAAQGKNNTVSYEADSFSQPISIALEYASQVTNPSELFSINSEIRVTCPVNETLTIINPDNQILIDTNFDGIYESGVTEYSSFEIRFRLNSSFSLPVGTGTFSVRGSLISGIKVTNLNLSDSNTSKVALRLLATCIPLDSDSDGIVDEYDIDADNDGILDKIEAQGANSIVLANTDTDNNGLDDAFGNGLTPADTDADGVFDYLDLDADNDGIYDIKESGSTALDANNNGIIDGSNFGTNGFANTLETAVDNGIPNYSVRDTDTDNLYDAIELDSDDDGCNDVIEAGFLDVNQDGILGATFPATVNTNGIVTSGIGYTNPNVNYITAAPISITTEPSNVAICELQNATFTITAPTVTSYQWQLSTDGGINWTNLTNTVTYSGTTTASLTISSVSPTFTGYRYRVVLNRIGNSCGLISATAILTTFPLPVITSPISLSQCDDDNDAITTFNLTQKNSFISTNYQTDTFTYYTTFAGANTANSLVEITNPLAYTSGTSIVYVRVENAGGCYRVATLNLLVSATQLPATLVLPNFYECDDYLNDTNDDRDGIAGFNFSGITNQIRNFLPPPNTAYTINFYKNEADFLAETDANGNSLAISDTSNYRNIGYPNLQTIWVRVDSTLDNACFGFKTFNVVVEALPFANDYNALNLIRHCDDDQDGSYGFDTSDVQSTILNGQTNVIVRYTRANGSQSSALPNPLIVSGSEIITIRVSNASTQTPGGIPCYDEMTLEFIVDDLPQIFPISSSLTQICDDEDDPLYQDGILSFNTTGFQQTLLGNQTGMNIRFFDQNNNPIGLPFPNLFTTATQNVTVTIENPINTTCTAQASIPFVVHPTPKIDLYEKQFICSPDTQVTLSAAIVDGTPTSDYSYSWLFNGTQVSANPTYIASTEGDYSVIVTNTFGCPMTRNIEVVSSQIASLQSIQISDLTDSNTIVVTVIGNGIYEYALDDQNGPYQTSNTFLNVPIGFHEVYVKDTKGCGIIGPYPAPVLGIPKYFTPNGDGFNDTWNVKGATAFYNKNSTIYIFDRYGKLLKQLAATGSGWDGTYNGQLMPGDDYWFNIQFEDGRSAKGHFALKR
jgi:gliding motility-associated-like protein